MKKRIAVISASDNEIEFITYIKGMEKATENKNVDLYVFTCNRFEENSGYINTTGYSIFNLVDYKNFDGIIIITDSIEDKGIILKEYEKILKSGKPAVSINIKLEKLDYIYNDIYDGFYDLVTHMIKVHNITKFVFFMNLKTSFEKDQKYNAFAKALEDNKLDIKNSQIIITTNDFFEMGYTKSKELFANKDALPQAIICSTDSIAYAVLKAAEDSDVEIPEEVKLISYDDLPSSKQIIPSLTTVNSKTMQMGYEAAKRLIKCFEGKTFSPKENKINTTPIIRQSCGCKSKFTLNQKKSSVSFISKTIQSIEFSEHLQNLEDVFLNSSDVFTLLVNLEFFFNKTHSQEGANFSILLKSDCTSILINSEEELEDNYSFGNQLQAIATIRENKKMFKEIIEKEQMIPQCLISDKSDTFLFFPIFNHNYVHGYFVNKNNIDFVANVKCSYFTRSFGTNIERFRQKNMYKQMSQQFFRLSSKDALSGLLNRIGLEKLAKPYFEENKLNGYNSILYFVDINSMKVINDKFGHLHGDLTVKTIAESISSVIPKNWYGIRYGGDEFLIVGNSKNYKNEDYATLIHENIRKRTEKMQLPYTMSVSIGAYAVPPTSPETFEQAIIKVDEIMYALKQEYHKTH